MTSEIKYPSYSYSHNPRAVGDDKQLVLVVITDSGSLPSCSIFDSKTDVLDFTKGRGSFFSSFLANTEEEMNTTLDMMEENLIEFTNTYYGETNKVKDKVRKITPRPTPPAQG